MTQSMAFLDDSIDFNKDVGLIVENSTDTSPLLTDRHRGALQADAAQLVDRFTDIYKDCEENSAVVQTVEMIELLVMENKHEVLGVSPKALQAILDLLRDKIVLAQQEYDDLDQQKEQFKEIHLLRDHCRELESDKERLQVFE